MTAAAIAGVTLRCDEIVIQIQGCLSHRALAAETNGGCILGGVGLILDCVAGHKIDHALRPLVQVARTFGMLLWHGSINDHVDAVCEHDRNEG